ncbi:MAG: hypothetical protein HY951_12100 [Bacteroidia bacterium]|nr:hypothetical protein [Bacteroidia bacterium]
MTQQDLFFEISDSVNFVRLEPIALVRENSQLDWDNNWIKTKVIVNCGAFSGQFVADFMTVDFEKFKQEFELLYSNFKGSAIFSGLEKQLELNILGDGLGHFEVNVKASDKPNEGNELTFLLSFDQTQIKELIWQLDTITKRFPIVGDFKIKNK